MKECRIFASVCGKCPAVVCRLGSIECIGYHLAKPIPVAVATGNYRLCDAIAKLNLLGTQRNNWRKQTRELQEEQINWLRFYCFSCTIFQFVHGFFIFIHHLPVTWFLSCNTHTRWRNQTYSVNLRYALCVARSTPPTSPSCSNNKQFEWKILHARGKQNSERWQVRVVGIVVIYAMQVTWTNQKKGKKNAPNDNIISRVCCSSCSIYVIEPNEKYVI